MHTLGNIQFNLYLQNIAQTDTGSNYNYNEDVYGISTYNGQVQNQNNTGVSTNPLAETGMFVAAGALVGAIMIFSTALIHIRQRRKKATN